ncbi:hypothetical protein ABPG75_007669 [Micractinium tetrahymenae]
MVAATAVSPATQVNVYVCQLFGITPRGASSALGFALPDAVFVDYRTLPGGPFTDYSGGRTATHEIGHWAGLAHVFDEAGACWAEGDGVADTPAQSTPTSGCPAAKDSCPGWPGMDSVHNFMDYSVDGCMHEFTAGQVVRMRAALLGIRPALVDASTIPAPPPPPSPPRRRLRGPALLEGCFLLTHLGPHCATTLQPLGCRLLQRRSTLRACAAHRRRRWCAATAGSQHCAHDASRQCKVHVACICSPLRQRPGSALHLLLINSSTPAQGPGRLHLSAMPTPAYLQQCVPNSCSMCHFKFSLYFFIIYHHPAIITLSRHPSLPERQFPHLPFVHAPLAPASYVNRPPGLCSQQPSNFDLQLSFITDPFMHANSL